MKFVEKDPFSPIRYGYTLKQILHSQKGPFGDVVIAESDYFGRMLILDGVVQLTERDEHFYHEMLAHVPLSIHPDPKSVLIIGGGDGGTLRETLKHKTVKRAVMAEIDPGVIEACKAFLPTLSTGFTDKRARIEITDGAKLVEQSRNLFDVILMDCTDPVGPALSLFSDEFFSNVSRALRKDGIFAAQTESLHFHLDFVKETQGKLRNAFPMVDLYTSPIATYAGNWWTFSIASKEIDVRRARPRPLSGMTLKYYATDVHRNAFLPRSLVKKLLG